MAWEQLDSDDFDRSDRSLNGDTSSGGGGAWQDVAGGGFSIVSLVAEPDAVDCVAGLGLFAGTPDDQEARAQKNLQQSQLGTAVRIQVDGSCYAERVNAGNNSLQVIRIDFSAGTMGFTVLGESGVGTWTGPADGTPGVKAVGTDITLTLDGTGIAGPAVDGTYSQGDAGMWADATVSRSLNDFEVWGEGEEEAEAVDCCCSVGSLLPGEIGP